ncbi:MAG TPA: DUF4910 domain-containing protein, partial [Longimicrobiales bacterium]|nr:DUF4910 domain-containing protein [Longimicrobiales bacterium]
MRLRGIISVVAVLVMATAHPLSAQTGGSLLDDRTRDLLHETLSGERAKDHVIQITRHHRIQGSRGYRDAAQYVLSELRKAGFSEADAYIESFPSDGRIHYQGWQSPSGWHIESAELRMTEPYDERIVGYPEVGMSVVTYSNAGHVQAELVWVGAGTGDSDYENRDVSGKIVLCTGNGGQVHRLAVLKYGASAVVCYLDDDRAQEYPDMLAYTGMWPNTHELENVRFGFNLTNRQGTRLRKLLESGQRVVLDARVDGPGLEPFEMDVVVAHVRGSGAAGEEIVLSAHLDHPKESANDNASGSAALLDMARSFSELIGSRRLPQPQRSIRFIWIPEYYGMMAYVDAHEELRGPELGGRFLANLNLDMVGEKLELLHSKMTLTRTPSSIPSALNDVVENMAQMVDEMDVRTPRGSQSAFNYRVTPYSGGSDHNMFIDRKIPGMMVNHSPDYTHHTSEDTPDKVDPVELERSEIIAAGAAWYLANLQPEQAIDLAHLTAANGAARVGHALRTAQRDLTSSADVARGWAEAQNRVDHALHWERDALRSILVFNSAAPVRTTVQQLDDQLVAGQAHLARSLAMAANARGLDGDRPPALGSNRDARVPIRLTRGPIP